METLYTFPLTKEEQQGFDNFIELLKSKGL